MTKKIKLQTASQYKDRVPEFSISLNSKVKPSERIQISSSQDTEKVFREIFDADSIDWNESMAMICLNRANKVLGFFKVSSGGLSGTVCDPRMIFQVALLSNASSIIVCHNHPSGSLKPSRADEELTRKLKESGAMLDIRLLDHIIITSESYFSFADDGLI